MISDYLFPHDADQLTRSIAGRSGTFTLLQVLGEFDQSPPTGAALRLTDVERGVMRDLVLDAPTLRAYRTRLERLGEELERAAHQLAGAFGSVGSGGDFDDVCRTRLLDSGVLAPV